MEQRERRRGLGEGPSRVFATRQGQLVLDEAAKYVARHPTIPAGNNLEKPRGRVTHDSSEHPHTSAPPPLRAQQCLPACHPPSFQSPARSPSSFTAAPLLLHFK